MSIVTCHTEGCSSDGVPVDMELTYVDPDTGLPRVVDVVICGACCAPITDIIQAVQEAAAAMTPPIEGV